MTGFWLECWMSAVQNNKIVYIFPETKQMMKTTKKRENFVKISFILSSRLVGWDFNVVQLLSVPVREWNKTKIKGKNKHSDRENQQRRGGGGAGHARMREIKRYDDGTTMKLWGDDGPLPASAIGSCVLYTHTGSKVSENEGFTNGRESRRSV